MLWQILKNIGFTERESKVYLALLERPNQPASIIAKQCGINRSTTYLVIQDLIKKGIIKSYTKKTIQYFEPVEPKFINNLLEIKENELKEKRNYFMQHLDKLQNISQKEQVKPKVSFYEGFEGVMACYSDSLTTSETELISFIRFDKIPQKFLTYLENKYLPLRIKKNIKTKIITQKPEFKTEWLKEDHKTENLREIKFYDLNLPLQVEIIAYDNKVAFIHLNEDKPFGIIIENQQVKQTIRAIHSVMWSFL